MDVDKKDSKEVKAKPTIGVNNIFKSSIGKKSEESKSPLGERKNSRFDSLKLESPSNGFKEERENREVRERKQRNHNENNQSESSNTDNIFLNNPAKKEEDLSLENIYQFPSLYTAEAQFKLDIENIHKNTLNLNYGKIKEEIETEAFAQKFVGFGVKREHKDIDDANSKLFNMLLKSSYKESKVNVFYKDYDDLDDWYDNKKNTIESITKRPYDPYMQGYCEECEKFERGDYDINLEDEEVIEETLFNDQEYFSKSFSGDI